MAVMMVGVFLLVLMVSVYVEAAGNHFSLSYYQFNLTNKSFN